MSNYTFERYGEIIHTDEFGNEFVLDEAGNRRPPMQSCPINEPGEFVHYDTRGGHCGICGRLGCHGGCFK